MPPKKKDPRRIEARRANAAEVVKAIGKRPSLHVGQGVSITLSGLEVNEDGCLVVTQASGQAPGRVRIVFDLPIVIANLPLTVVRAGTERFDPEAALGELMLELAHRVDQNAIDAWDREQQAERDRLAEIEGRAL